VIGNGVVLDPMLFKGKSAKLAKGDAVDGNLFVKQCSARKLPYHRH